MDKIIIAKDYFTQDCKLKENSSSKILIKQQISIRKKDIKDLIMDKRKRFTNNNHETMDYINNESKEKIHQNIKSLSLVK